MASTIAAAPQQINLYNPALRPARETFSARQLTAWMVLAALAMGAVGWWATRELRELRREISGQPAGADPAEAGPTPQQVATLERQLRERQALRDARQAARDTLRRGTVAAGSVPSAVLREVADSIPETAWLSEIKVAGARLEMSGRALDAGAVNAWLARMRSSGFLAPRPAAGVRIERLDAAALPAGARGQATYAFHLSASLGAPFADEGGRP